jgi:hypothetical protein
LVTVAYYDCPVVGDGLSTETALSPSLAAEIEAEACPWAQIRSSDGTMTTIQVSDQRADGSTAVGLHDSLEQQAPFATQLLAVALAPRR